jgi:cell division protein FtsB
MFEDVARKYGIIIVFFAMCFTLFVSPNGILDYVKLKKQISAKDVSISTLQKENLLLKGEIQRLQHDDKYLEDVARSRFGFIRDGEKVYRIEK